MSPASGLQQPSFPNPFALWWGWLAPGQLTQPILPGWTFSGVTVNEQNSSAPDTEREIVSEQSYGRQLGKLLDAVAALIAERKGEEDLPAFSDLLELRDRIEQIKARTAEQRLDQVPRDLAQVKSVDREAYQRRLVALRHLLAGSE
jgi:hypothetical protein